LVVNLETSYIPDRRRKEGKYLIINKIHETWQSLTEIEEHDIDHFDQIFEVYKDTDVYRNLLRLATGLESLVLGRLEILDEIKASISSAKLAKMSGRILNKLFDSSLQIATRIRDSTEISKGITSLGDLAIKTAEEKVGLDEKKNVLLIGTGEAAALVAKSLNDKDKKFSVTSMTIERATGFSKILGGTPIEFESALSTFDKFDIIFVATTADYHFINHHRLRRVMEKKKTGTLMLDISSPRAVEDKVSTFPGIKLMFRDQIDEMYEEYLTVSKAKVPAVEKMISQEIPILEETMIQLKPEPIVEDTSASANLFRMKELKKALTQLGETDEKKIKIIDDLTKAIAEGLVSTPVNNSKKALEQDNS